MYAEELIQKLKVFEGFRSRPYRCVANRLTIGYGHTDGVKLSDSLTRVEADRVLRHDCDIIDKMLKSCNINFPEFKQSALIEFCFNVGFTSFKKSRLYNYIVNYDPLYDDMICNLFLIWCKYHDKDNVLRQSAALYERRKYDCELWRR